MSEKVLGGKSGFISFVKRKAFSVYISAINIALWDEESLKKRLTEAGGEYLPFGKKYY